ncbi:ABC transporter permease [Knoellia locipacati]|uniref:ABC transporter permease n=1 Tax=Knoellia locipacati TaxID=882824 RepID=UPI00384FD473
MSGEATAGLSVDVTSAPTRPWHRLRRSVPGLLGLAIMAVLLVVAVLAWLGVLPYDPIAQDAPNRLQRPSGAHWFGTDQFGRDVFSRVAAGLANSVLIAGVAVALSAVVGTLAGVVAGYLRGAVDAVAGGVANVFFAFPPLLLALTLVSVLDRTWFTVALAIAVVYVPIFFRVARGPVLSLREQDFVRAAVSTGQNPWATMALHVLPNISGLVIVQTALSLSWAVLTEASLSFLGLGAPPPAPSLGSMIFESRNIVSIANWTMIAPGIIVVLLVAGLNLLGDGLRDAFDVKGRD